MPEKQATQRLAEILGQIAKLPSANLEPPQFFANYLQLSIMATGSKGGALWVIQPQQPPQCYCHLELDLCQIKEPKQQQLVIEAIQRAVSEAKPLVIPAGGVACEVGQSAQESGSALTNQCGYPLFFKPLKAANQIAMVMQLVGSSELDPHEFRAVVGLLGQIGESAETYLAHRRAAVLEEDRKALAKLLQMAEGVHESLEPDKVLYHIANLGRDAVGCDRVVVWVDPKVKRGLRAVSGVDKPDRRAVLLQSLERLSKHCLEIKKPIVAARKQLVEMSEDDKLTHLLTEYFNISQLDQIFLQPLTAKESEDYLGVLIAEGFDEQSGVNIAGLIAAVAKHGGIALANALHVAALPVVRPFAKLRQVKKDPKKKRKFIAISTVLLIAIVICTLLPWPVKVDCVCELTPSQMRLIDSPLDGVQITKIVRSEGLLAPQEIIAQLDDVELIAQLHSSHADLAQAKIRMDQAVRSTEREYYKKECHRLESQIELLDQMKDRCTVRAPIAGTILTAQLQQSEGLTLKKGDLICEIADLSRWQLLLDVPQEEVGWVQLGLTGESAVCPVEFFLTAYPQEKLHAEVTSVDQIGQMPQITEDGNVYQIRLDVSSDELAAISSGLRPGSTGRAKIQTCDRALGYVMARKVIRFLRVTFF